MALAVPGGDGLPGDAEQRGDVVATQDPIWDALRAAGERSVGFSGSSNLTGQAGSAW